MAQWTKELKACRRSEGQTCVMKIPFCNNTENAVKINNSLRFAAKRCKKYAVKIIVFSPHFTAFLTKIHHQTSTRLRTFKKFVSQFDWWLTWTQNIKGPQQKIWINFKQLFWLMSFTDKKQTIYHFLLVFRF